MEGTEGKKILIGKCCFSCGYQAVDSNLDLLSRVLSITGSLTLSIIRLKVLTRILHFNRKQSFQVIEVLINKTLKFLPRGNQGLSTRDNTGTLAIWKHFRLSKPEECYHYLVGRGQECCWTSMCHNHFQPQRTVYPEVSTVPSWEILG